MKISIEGFDQSRAVELGLCVADVVLLRWFVDFSNTGAMEKRIIDGKEYFWISYEYVPDDFSGNLLDVPVGTAVFTENKWSSLKNAHITCLDYSIDMLDQARKRLGSHAHIKCIQRKRYWQRLP